MDKKVTGILSYFGIVLWLVAYFAGDKEGAKFQLNQTLTLAIAEIVLSVCNTVLGGLSGIIGVFFSLIILAASIFLLVCWIIGFIGACQGQDKPMPVIGSIQILK